MILFVLYAELKIVHFEVDGGLASSFETGGFLLDIEPVPPDLLDEQPFEEGDIVRCRGFAGGENRKERDAEKNGEKENGKASVPVTRISGQDGNAISPDEAKRRKCHNHAASLKKK
jgi:hypothetical protein